MSPRKLVITGLALPLIWIGVFMLLVASGQLMTLPSQDINQMPPEVYEQYMHDTQTSNIIFIIWSIVLLVTITASITIIVRAIIKYRRSTLL